MHQQMLNVEEEKPSYRPLVGDEIRLLTLLPPLGIDSDEPIRCSLESLSPSDYAFEYREWLGSKTQAPPHETLRLWKEQSINSSNDENKEDTDFQSYQFRHSWGDYIALSYTWGSPETPKHIILDGVPVAVTANLDAALRNVLSLTQTRNSRGCLRVWADAICINQKDQNERCREIKRMRSIFAGALGVVVALGSGWEGCDEAFEIIRTLAPSIIEGLTYTELKKNAVQYGLFKGSIGPLLKLMYHPYWRRVWVIQELAVGADPIIIACGHSRLLLEQLRTVVMSIFLDFQKISSDGILPTDHFREIHSLDTLGLLTRYDVLRSVSRSVEQGHKADSIDLAIAVLSLGMMGKCSDPRDQIYGLLGLLPGDIINKIVVDYSETEHQIYIDFSKACIEATGDLNILSLRSQRQQSRPSWVTDRTKGFERCYLFYERCFNYTKHPMSSEFTRKSLFGIDERRITSRADNHRQASISFSGSGHSTKLHCQGVCLGEIDGFSAEAFTMAEPISAEATQAIQPKSAENPYGDNKATIRALIATLSQNPSSNSASDTAAFADLSWCGSEADSDSDTCQFNPGPAFSALIEHVVEQAPWVAENINPFVTFETARRVLGRFRIGGKPLKEYFPAADSTSNSPHFTQSCVSDMALIGASMIGRRLAVLKSGHLALVPAVVRSGDQVWVLYGASMPVLLRSCVLQEHDGNCAEVVGECYVEGFMSGEGVDAVERGERKNEKVVLC